MAARRTRRAIAVAASLAAGCSSDGPAPVVGTPTVTTVEPRMGPTSPEELGIALDPSGRPYDAPIGEGTEVEPRLLDRFHITDGRLRVLDGNALEVRPTNADAHQVDFGVEELDVRIVWERLTIAGREREDVLGVRVEVPGATVARWGPFEPAYGTDGGVGAITSQAVIDRAEAGPDVDLEQVLEVFDLDGEPGPDSMVFHNGFGDGGFPMSRGTDADGELVAMLIWHTRYPWRLAVPDGTPPPDVTEREQQLQECIDGTRLVDEHGRCTDDA